MDHLNVRGEFWLPDNDTAKVAGILSFDPQNGGRLKLIGAFGDSQDYFQRSGASRIHGAAEGRYYTLENCFESRRHGAFTGYTLSDYVVNEIFRGALFTHDEPIGFNRMFLGLADLTAWIGQSGLSGDSGLGKEPFSIEAKGIDLPEQEIEVDGFRLKLWHQTYNQSDAFRSEAIMERHRFTIAGPRVTGLPTWLDLASDLQDLLTIAFHRPVAYEDLCFSHEDVYRSIQGRRHYETIDMLARWHATPTDTPRAPMHHEMVLTFDELGGMDGIRRWMEVARTHRHALSRIIASRHSDKMWTDDRFANLASAAEGLHRKITRQKNRNLVERIRGLINIAGDVFTEALPHHDYWAQRVKWERDEIAHHYERRPRDEGTVHFFLAESLYWLLVLCLLRQADAPEGAIQHLASSRVFIYDMQQTVQILDALQRH